MGNIAEQIIWESGIRQLEETDDVVAGPDGVSNTQAKQLANRTAWLKNQITGAELITGSVTVKNKYVVSGFELPADLSESERSIYFQESADGNGYANNYSLWGGRLIRVYAQSVAVPWNETDQEIVKFIFVKPYNNTFVLDIGDSVPFGSMGIYMLTIPAFDTAENMYDSPTVVTDIRTFSGYCSWVSTPPEVLVALPAGAVDDTNYSVYLELTYASNQQSFGSMTVYDRATNGFKIQLQGMADDAIIRWTLQKIVLPSGS